jgi:exodeoxyribonuclease VII small subunit
MTTLHFEKALAELEETVARLESGELSLDESLELFEKGVRLAKFLRGELDKAEKKIEVLLKDEEGGLKAEPFEAAEPADEGSRDEGDGRS